MALPRELEDLLDGLLIHEPKALDKPLLRNKIEQIVTAAKAGSIQTADIDSYLEKKLTSSITGVELPSDNVDVGSFNPDELLAHILERRTRIRTNITTIERLSKVIDAKVASTKPSVEVNLKRNILLKGAIRRVFGETTGTLTYSMYKKCLELQERHSKEELAGVKE